MEGEPAALYDIPNGYVLAKIYFSKVPYEIPNFPVRNYTSDLWECPY